MPRRRSNCSCMPIEETGRRLSAGLGVRHPAYRPMLWLGMRFMLVVSYTLQVVAGALRLCRDISIGYFLQVKVVRCPSGIELLFRYASAAAAAEWNSRLRFQVVRAPYTIYICTRIIGLR